MIFIGIKLLKDLKKKKKLLKDFQDLSTKICGTLLKEIKKTK